ncbi:MAG TPA: sugar ABC transporter permease [Clostridiales bacterium]|nr:sugar ABC transporter permease [Clostridiales bacterium]
MRTVIDAPPAVQKRKKRLKTDYMLCAMLIPGSIYLIIFDFFPLFGLVIGFQDFQLAKGILGSKWVGLENFKYLFTMYPNFWRIVSNTVQIAALKLCFGFTAPIIVALMLHEVRHIRYKRTIQTLVYVPHFISWVILAGILRTMLDPSDGIVNYILNLLGHESVYFLGENSTFRGVLVVSDVWKGFGWGTIIYMAALTGIDPALYEAAIIDGAGRFKRMWHITLPGIMPFIILNLILSVPGILNAGFDQIFNLYNERVYKTADVLDTFIYRLGIVDAQYDLSTAIGLVKSAISAVLLVTSYKIANKFYDYKVF